MSRGRDFDLAIWGWSAPTTLTTNRIGGLVASDFSRGFLNVGGFRSPAADQLVATLDQATDQDAAKVVVGQLQELIARDVPFVPLYYPDQVNVYRPAVRPGTTARGDRQLRIAQNATGWTTGRARGRRRRLPRPRGARGAAGNLWAGPFAARAVRFLIALGTLAAAVRQRRRDTAGRVLMITLDALPPFWVGMLLIFSFGVTLKLLRKCSVTRWCF